MNGVQLSDEQLKFVNWSKMGVNVLVDACIGSGKTTAIQSLVSDLAGQKRILYLTYNKLLKLDAKDRIHAGGTYVTNYHGFAFTELLRRGMRCGFNDIMQVYNREKPVPPCYDLMVLDEYQDISSDVAEMLQHIKDHNPGMQIVAVGDMDQKIYDYTRLKADDFIIDFLGRDYRPMEFTKCFRLNREWAGLLGDVWEKSIIGVNDDCEVLEVTEDEAVDLAAACRPSDLLVLGAKNGKMSDLQNELEENLPDIFNKYSVWSKIRDNDGGTTQPSPECAIFTTYDGCKGMERDTCIIYDWTKQYWQNRISHEEVSYDIMRNIFCVAASRGKKQIAIVREKKVKPLTFQIIKDSGNAMSLKQTSFSISSMFDYKYAEDIEECFALLDVEQVQKPTDVINAPMSDGLIDLSPCIGNYQEASFFKDYDIDSAITHARRMNKGELVQKYNTSGWSVFGKVLYLTALETNLVRYISQVSWNFVPDWVKDEIHARLSTVFTGKETVQQECSLNCTADHYGEVILNGVCDVFKDNVVWELKFVGSLAHTHFLQCACYLLATDIKEGMLFNVRDGEMWKIRIPDRKAFLNKVVTTITKGQAGRVADISERDTVLQFVMRHPAASRELFDMGYRGLTVDEAEDYMNGHGFVLDVPMNHFIRYFTKKTKRRSALR